MTTKVSSSLGYQQQLVQIMELRPNDGNVRCQNPRTHEEYYASLTQRHYMAWPQVGEYWVITRNLGPWDLTVKLTNASPPVISGTTAPGSTLTAAVSTMVALGLAQDGTTPLAVEVPGLGANWATKDVSAAAAGLRYWIDEQNHLVLMGSIHTTSTSPAATIFTLPSAPVDYSPPNTHRIPITTNVSGTHSANDLVVNSSGAVSLGTNLTTTNTDVYIYARMPLFDIS